QSAPHGGFELTLKPTIIDLWGNALDPNHRQLSVKDRTRPHLLQVDLLDREPWGVIVNRIVHPPSGMRQLLVTFDKPIDTDTLIWAPKKNQTADVLIKDPSGHTVRLTDVVPVFAPYPQPQAVQFIIWVALPPAASGPSTLEVTTGVTDVYANPLAKQYDLPFQVLSPLTTPDLPLAIQDRLEQLGSKLAQTLPSGDPRNPPDPTDPTWNQDIARLSSILTWAELAGDKLLSHATEETTLRPSAGSYKEGVASDDRLRDQAMINLIDTWKVAGLLAKDRLP